jgi:hypothetical protein
VQILLVGDSSTGPSGQWAVRLNVDLNCNGKISRVVSAPSHNIVIASHRQVHSTYQDDREQGRDSVG